MNDEPVSFELDPSDPVAVGACLQLLAGRIRGIEADIAGLARVLAAMAQSADMAELQNISFAGQRLQMLKFAADIAKHDFPDSAILRAIAAGSSPEPPEPSRPKFAVVGGTDTEPAAGQSDGLQQVEPIACAPAQEPVPPIAGDPTTT